MDALLLLTTVTTPRMTFRNGVVVVSRDGSGPGRAADPGRKLI